MKPIQLTGSDDPNLEIFKCNEVQLLHYYEPHGGLFMAETTLVIERAIEAGCKPVAIVAETKAVTGSAADLIARFPEVPVYTGPLEMIDQLTGFHLSRGVLCAMRRPEPLDPAQILQNSRRICIMEEVMNPTNVGALFRSAAALGVDGVLLTHGSSNPYYRRAARVSMGNVFQVPWCVLPEHTDYIGLVKEAGFAVASMALSEQSVSVADPQVAAEEKLAIVMGTEAWGLKQETLERSDYVVKIPMMEGVDSLNVAVAGSIAFWQLCAQGKLF